MTHSIEPVSRYVRVNRSPKHYMQTVREEVEEWYARFPIGVVICVPGSEAETRTTMARSLNSSYTNCSLRLGVIGRSRTDTRQRKEARLPSLGRKRRRLC